MANRANFAVLARRVDAAFGGHEIILVPAGLHRQEDPIEPDRHHDQKRRLQQRQRRSRRRHGVVRQHETQHRHRDDHGEESVRTV